MSITDKYSPRKIGTIVDIAHIVIGISVVIMTVLAVTMTERFMVFFPLIFLLSGVLSGVTGWYGTVIKKTSAKHKLMIGVYFVIAVLLTALFVISAISIWFN